MLCFGGQTRETIALSKEVYQSIVILRMHLDHCDAVCRSLGVTKFYPEIFSKNSIEDIVLLHCMLFALQYSCARSWIDCGLRVDALIGHSFGQLTALCVSGSISLENAIRLVKGRAVLIQDFWGPERGVMISIESGLETLSEILSLAQGPGSGRKIEIACYNGPTTHVLVGTECSIRAIEDAIALKQASSEFLKAKRLHVTHGFHSHLADSIIPGLLELTNTIDFQTSKIPVETCTRNQSWTRVEPRAVAEHSREPVYFSEAVHRLQAQYGRCTWLEAGTDSTITSMVRHALNPPGATHMFQPISLTSTNAMKLLVDATVNLWKSGLKVQFWPFNRLQRHHYSQLNLPLYQSEKHRHWLEYEELAVQSLKNPDIKTCQKSSLLSFVSLVRPQNAGNSLAQFQIDSESQQFKAYIQGHTVLGSSLCPASLYIHLAAKAASTLFDDSAVSSGPLCVKDLEMHAPLGLDPERVVSLCMETADETPLT